MQSMRDGYCHQETLWHLSWGNQPKYSAAVMHAPLHYSHIIRTTGAVGSSNAWAPSLLSPSIGLLDKEKSWRERCRICIFIYIYKIYSNRTYIFQIEHIITYKTKIYMYTYIYMHIVCRCIYIPTCT